jgi:hypothetical protein
VLAIRVLKVLGNGGPPSVVTEKAGYALSCKAEVWFASQVWALLDLMVTNNDEAIA